MNIPAGCKPFDLEAALAGAKTVHRDGLPGPLEFHLLPDWAGEPVFPLFARLATGFPARYRKDGRFAGHTDSSNDLFMVPVEKHVEAWAVMTAGGDMRCPLSTEAAAKSVASCHDNNYPDSAPHTVLRLSGKWKG